MLRPARWASSLVESGPSSIASSPARVRPISAASASDPVDSPTCQSVPTPRDG